MQMSAPEQSQSRRAYLQKLERRKHWVDAMRLLTLLLFFALWEILTRQGILNPFIFSSPSRILEILWMMSNNGELLRHVATSVVETVAGFFLGTFFGIWIAAALWWNPFLSDVSEPYLIVLNALPKTALGPIFIVCMGAGTGAIVAMTLAISLIVTILTVWNGFLQTDKGKIRLLRSMGAGRMQIFTKLVLPSNFITIVNAMKVNIGLSWVGAITGEFLVSKAGLGYLIVYGSQVFKMALVMASVLILAVFALVMQGGVILLERFVREHYGMEKE